MGSLRYLLLDNLRLVQKFSRNLLQFYFASYNTR
jgi:hypothetical protein